MAKLTVLPEQAIIDGFKGTIDMYLWKGIPCARSWPRSPGKRRAPAVEAQWDTFTYATRIWSYMSPEVQAAYEEARHGTYLSARDLAIKGFLSGYLPE